MALVRILSHARARRVYDRIGSFQDSQRFYEDPATGLLLRLGRFQDARHVFEFGCGTGRLAARLLSEHLPAGARYRGVDLSATMVRLAQGRLAPFGRRAGVEQSDGGPPIGEASSAYDRLVSAYVLDLLSDDEIADFLREAQRILDARGLLCLCGLSTGSGPMSRTMARAWTVVHRLSPSLVGGCRPLELLDHVSSSSWRILHHERLAPFAIPSEVLVVERV